MRFVKNRGAKFWQSGSIPLIAPEILGDIITDVSDIGVVVSDDCTVLSVLVNPINVEFRKLEEFEGRDFRTSLTDECVVKFDRRLASYVKGDGPVRPVELNHRPGIANFQFPIRYSFHRIGPDDAVLLLGRDLRPVAEMQQQLVKAQIAVERDHETRREFDARFRVLMQATQDAVLFVSSDTGKVIEANDRAADLLDRSRQEVVGSAISALFEVRKGRPLIEMLGDPALSAQGGAVRAGIKGSGRQVAIAPTVFRAAGEKLFLCRIDVREADRAAAPQMQAMAALYENGPDGMVFARADGAITWANRAFLHLADAPDDAIVQGRNLIDNLQRGSVDLNVMIDNTVRAGRMRHYATRFIGDHGTPRSVEMSVTRLDAGGEEIFGFVIRDVSRMDAARPAGGLSEENTRSVLEMVGTAPLKDIVAASSDVVEKMCIEAAVDLTQNNRVAVAELLGLSRQSLYVKLRKYGLIAKNAKD